MNNFGKLGLDIFDRILNSELDHFFCFRLQLIANDHPNCPGDDSGKNKIENFGEL